MGRGLVLRVRREQIAFYGVLNIRLASTSYSNDGRLRWRGTYRGRRWKARKSGSAARSLAKRTFYGCHLVFGEARSGRVGGRRGRTRVLSLVKSRVGTVITRWRWFIRLFLLGIQ
jgi:hypothetical protein